MLLNEAACGRPLHDVHPPFQLLYAGGPTSGRFRLEETTVPGPGNDAFPHNRLSSQDSPYPAGLRPQGVLHTAS
jgi:hypothetical protein